MCFDKFQFFFFEPKTEKMANGSEVNMRTEREIEVLKTIALGNSNKQIARKLLIIINDNETTLYN